MRARKPRYTAEQAAEILLRMSDIQEDASENEDNPLDADSGDEFALPDAIDNSSDLSLCSEEEPMNIDQVAGDTSNKEVFPEVFEPEKATRQRASKRRLPRRV